MAAVDSERDAASQADSRESAGTAGVTTEAVQASLAEQLSLFQRQRRAEIQAQLRIIVLGGFTLVLVGIVVFAVGVFLQALAPFTGQAGMAAGLWTGSCGVLLISTCPMDVVDLDGFFEQRPLFHFVMGVLQSTLTLTLTLWWPPPFYAVGLPWCFLLTIGGPLNAVGPPWQRLAVKPTMCFGGLFSAHLVGWTVHHLYLSSPLPAHARFVAVAWPVGGFLVMVAAWMPAGDGLPNLSNSVRWLFSFYMYFFSSGMGIATWAIYKYTHKGWPAGYGARQFAAELADAAGRIFPALVLCTFGPARLFQASVRRLEHLAARALHDGSFIASLLDSKNVRVGEEWWLHRGEGQKDPEFGPEDHRHNWRRGFIAEVHEDFFQVRVLRPRAYGHRRSSLGLRQSLRVRARSGEAFARLISTAGHQHRVRYFSSHGELWRVPLKGRGATAEQLLEAAQRQLKCVDWDALSEDFMASSSAAAPTAEPLGRSLRPREQIDYFLSHSWHDDARSKWTALCAFAQRTSAREGHHPSFWIDKACIDQSNIADGLRALPVNVMACRRVLVCWGATYPSRLWCVWELFTVVAFAGVQDAARRLEFVSLAAAPGGGSRPLSPRPVQPPLSRSLASLLPGRTASLRTSGSSVPETFHDQLRRFSVDAAHCYDPNEERLLRSVIQALGADRFNGRVRELGGVLAKQQEERAARDNNMSRSVAHAITNGMRTFSRRGLSPGRLGSTTSSMASTCTREECASDLAPSPQSGDTDEASNCTRGTPRNGGTLRSALQQTVTLEASEPLREESDASLWETI